MKTRSVYVLPVIVVIIAAGCQPPVPEAEAILHANEGTQLVAEGHAHKKCLHR